MASDAADFRAALANFPSGITLVTTRDADGKPWGFAATSFCSVSAEPPLVLVCLATTAQCYPVFESAQRWMIHVVHGEHSDLVDLFATRGADKFGSGAFADGPGGLPMLSDASVVMECSRFEFTPAGDHSILLGRVESAAVNEPHPVVYFQRKIHPIGVN
ncbi:MAG: flavin reductase family protein [Cumulibacter sp.]